MVQYSADLLDAARAGGSFADLLEVRRVALKHDLPFWNIVSSNQIRMNTTIASPANMMHQAYTTLAAGGRGLSRYAYYDGSGPRRVTLTRRSMRRATKLKPGDTRNWSTIRSRRWDRS
ncbi:MAG: hypothetical protein ACUVXJ_15060 [Phycisphaerae bacterium]